MPNQNPLPFQVRGGGGQIRVRCAVPTSFLRECGEPTTRADDLTYSSEQLPVLSNQFAEITVAQQCRTSRFRVTGFAFEPSHPGERHPERLNCGFIVCPTDDEVNDGMSCIPNVFWPVLAKIFRTVITWVRGNRRCHRGRAISACSRGNAGGRPGRQADVNHILDIETSG